MKTLSCRDAGCGCEYVAKGETEEDVLRDAVQHGMKKHGITDNDMTQMRNNLKHLIVPPKYSHLANSSTINKIYYILNGNLANQNRLHNFKGHI